MTDTRVSAASNTRGSIYDLGYRHYAGRRLGRGYAFWSLFVESFRSVWGFGRSARAKAAPFIVTGLYSIFAVIQLAFSSFFAQQIAQGEAPRLFTYDNYLSSFFFFLIIFCVAQAPELVCRDQRYSVLPLYFTRALGKLDYALAKVAALAVSMFVVLMIPMVALFIGDVLMKPDAFAAIGKEWPKALPSIPASAITAAGFATLSLAISAFSPRRAYSAIGLIAYFLLMEAVPSAIYAIGQRSDWTWASNLLLLRPVTTLIGASNFIFGLHDEPDFVTGMSLDLYAGAAIAAIVVFLGILLVRYRRIGV